jgi:hypothetical protein
LREATLGHSSAEAALTVEAILLHVAGLVPPPAALADAPPDARDHADRLRSIWSRFEPLWIDRCIPPTRRWYRGIRPVNFPPRRLAGVARLLARSFAANTTPLRELNDRIRALGADLELAKPGRAMTKLIRDAAAWFDLDPVGDFWETHYSFEAKPADRSMRLIGEATARSLFFNAGLPLALLTARLEGDATLEAAARRVFNAHPPLAPNRITGFMAERLFGKDGGPAGMFRTERRQQGLFQVFYACCRGESNHCDCCFYLEGSASGWPLTPS